MNSEQPKDEKEQVPTRQHVDYTAMEHHEEIPDSSDTGDPSRPQGQFWHRNERPGADAIASVHLGEDEEERA